MTDSDGTRGPPWARSPGLRVMTDSRPHGSRTPPDMRVTADSVGRRSRTTCSANWQSGLQGLIGAPRTEPHVTQGRVTGRPPEPTRPRAGVSRGPMCRAILPDAICPQPRPARRWRSTRRDSSRTRASCWPAVRIATRTLRPRLAALAGRLTRSPARPSERSMSRSTVRDARASPGRSRSSPEQERDPSPAPGAGARLPRSSTPARNRRRRRPARAQSERAIGRRDRPGGAVSLHPGPASAVRGLVSRSIDDPG